MKVFAWIAVNLMPVLCIIFVLNCVSIAKKIKKGDEHTARNTVWITISFTLIMYSIIGVSILSY